MIDGPDRLDALLDTGTPAGSADSDLEALGHTADEVYGALSAWRVSARERDRIYARAQALSAARAPFARLRALRLDRRVQALAGGAVVTVAAGAALALTIARGRRRSPSAALPG